MVEEHLEGEELSLLALCDAQTAVPLASAQDYKRIFDGDQGPNTGGMGSYSPVPAVDDAAGAGDLRVGAPAGARRARATGDPVPGNAVRGADDDRRRAAGARVQRALRRPRDPGDPPAPASRICSSCSSPRRSSAASPEPSCEWAPEMAVSVVLASAGYPATSSHGDVITGLEAASALGPGHPRGDRAERRRPDRDRRRPGAERDRARRRRGVRPRGRLCCRGHDPVRRQAASPRHRAQGRASRTRMTEFPRPRPGSLRRAGRRARGASRSTRRWSGS